MIKKEKFPSELRLDLASGDWVVVATGRAKRPKNFKKEKRKKINISPRKCPFCNIETQETPRLIFVNGKKVQFEKEIPKKWTTIVIPNKYPAFLPQGEIKKKIEGNLYQTINAVGYCELVVTKNHYQQFCFLSEKHLKEVIDVYQERYLCLSKEKFVNYISIFHNQGVESGASQPHSHSQIITSPLIDVSLKAPFLNAKKFFTKEKECLYCRMNQWEEKVKKRIVFENKSFLVICPFASKCAFEMIITPKKHLSYFEKIGEKEKWDLANALKTALFKLYKGLNDPAYNFYFHTAPCDGKKYPFYHWHITILPKTGIWAGFELGTQMEISTIEPEKAAQYLKKQ